jgi:hypothetical protein
MIDINKEAEEYAKSSLLKRKAAKHFIAGYNSKATQAKVLQGQIDLLLHFRDTFQFSMASSNWKDELIKLQQKLKQLQNE